MKIPSFRYQKKEESDMYFFEYAVAWDVIKSYSIIVNARFWHRASIAFTRNASTSTC